MSNQPARAEVITPAELAELHARHTASGLVMTATELRQLWLRIIAMSRWEPSKALLFTWTEQAAAGRWTLAEAVAALTRWHSDHGENAYLDTAAIARLIRADRQDRALRAEAARARQRVAEIEQARQRQHEGDPDDREPHPRGEPASDEFRRQTLAGIAADLGWDTLDADADPDVRETALAVACPHCGAPPAEFCHVLSRAEERQRLTKRGAHPSRVDALHALQDTAP